MIATEQSDCFLLTAFPAELRLKVYQFLLADCINDTAQMTGALSSCRKINAEIDYEMTHDLMKKIGPILNDVTTAWNKVSPPFKVTVLVNNADLKSHDVIVHFELPKSAFITHNFQDSAQSKSKDLLMPLMCLDFEELKISLFEDDAYTNRECRSPSASINRTAAWECRLLSERFNSSELNRIQEFDDVDPSLYTDEHLRDSSVRQIRYDMGTALTNEEWGDFALLCRNMWSYGTYTDLYVITAQGYWFTWMHEMVKDGRFLKDPPLQLVWTKVKR